MTVVERHFFDQGKDGDFKEHPVKGRQLAAEVAASPLVEPDHRVHDEEGDDMLVEEHPYNSLLHSLCIRLWQQQIDSKSISCIVKYCILVIQSCNISSSTQDGTTRLLDAFSNKFLSLAFSPSYCSVSYRHVLLFVASLTDMFSFIL